MWVEPAKERATPPDEAARLTGQIRKKREEVVSLPLQSIGVVMSLLTVSIYALVVAEGRFTLVDWVCLIGLSSLLILGSWWMRQVAVAGRHSLPLGPVLVFLGLSPVLWEVFARYWLDQGLPFELLTMSGLRNIVVGLGIVCVWQRYQAPCVVMNLFLALFGASAGHDLAIQALAAGFTLLAMSWLVASHWENVRRRLHARQAVHLPRALFVLPIILVGLVGVSLAGGSRGFTTALKGWLPSSGGDQGADRFARGGVGDGELLVAGANRIQSFAPIDDAPFMQDDQPSLYDIYDDSYEEPVRSQNDRAVALPPELAGRAREHLHVTTEQAHREFSLLRQPREEAARRRAHDLRSDALLYVAGRVPLHLRLEAFDLFDGETWYPEQEGDHPQPPRMISIGGKPWCALADRAETYSFLGAAETHALKIVRLETNVIPAPPFVHGIHIDLVERSDLYRHRADQLVALDRRELPRLTPIHVASRAVDWSQLPAQRFLLIKVGSCETWSPPDSPLDEPSLAAGGAEEEPPPRSVVIYRFIPETVHPERLRELAEAWTAGRRTGWDEISAIVQKLRTEYVHDRAALPSSGTSDALAEFLFESRRGPDYQFATAAAMLLRSLGYSTRVVSGFYADASKYDPVSRHTPVHADDVHFWVEVRAGAGDWLTVEPTPGYEVLGPPPGWLARGWSVVQSGVVWMLRHWIPLGLLTSSLLVLLRFRLEWIDALDATLQRWRIGRGFAEPEETTFWFFERRAWRARRPRRPGMTTRRWLHELATWTQPEIVRRLNRLAESLDRMTFSPAGISQDTGRQEARDDSLKLIDSLSLEWFRRLRAIVPAAGDQPPGNVPPDELSESPHRNLREPVTDI